MKIYSINGVVNDVTDIDLFRNKDLNELKQDLFSIDSDIHVILDGDTLYVPENVADTFMACYHNKNLLNYSNITIYGRSI